MQPSADTTIAVGLRMPVSRSAPGVLVLLRHGESSTNAAGVFTGWSDPPLTAAGERQARRAARRLAAAGIRPDSVHTSVRGRAIRTAELVCAELDLDPTQRRSGVTGASTNVITVR